MAKKTKKREILPPIPNPEELFGPFLAANPHSRIKAVELDDRTRHVLEKPWDDDSLALVLVPQNAERLSAALNAVLLPQRFSAIWHSDTKDLEVVWTAFELSEAAQEVAARQFDFSFSGKSYRCEFGESSSRLLEIAKAAMPIRGTATNYRNLQSFTMYANKVAESKLGKPMSFWIRSIDWNEDAVIDLAYHLNFYMSYFDDRTPKIIIHARPEVSNVQPQERYIVGKFPASISGAVIDLNLLHFWQAAHGAEDQSKSFLYYYRLIEYASTTYIDREARAAVRRLLAQPNALDDIPNITERLVLATQSTKQDDDQRIRRLLEDTVDRSQVAKEIDKNLGLFNRQTIFEGGFNLDALVGNGQKGEQFDLLRFVKQIKDIRNALSHGRDIRTQMVIIPTQKNFDLLQPWVTLMCVVAGQVILFRGIS
ncbi:hypothetical protein ACQR05_10190 [Bradyrhizobium oligotrophicum]|uniref:hypothetical protein n=1 Tax=Bradyrhizobium oligotrophicum TaxID=44255 RepID=UPI003EBD4BEF